MRSTGSSPGDVSPSSTPDRAAPTGCTQVNRVWLPTRCACEGATDGSSGTSATTDGGGRSNEERRPARVRRAGCRRTTSRPRSRCSARCCCRATPSAPSARWRCVPPTSTSRRTSTSSTPSAPLYSAGAPADTSPSPTSCARPGCSTEIGGVETLHALQNATPAISNAAHYAKHRAGHGAAAPPDPRRRRHRRAGLQRARRRHQGARRGRDQGVQGRRAAGHRLDAAAPASSSTG